MEQFNNNITNETKKRLIYDITDLYKNPLTSENIYYIHDDTNMLKGYALIIGPPDTPYEHGFYFFEFKFPTNYPYSPPKVIYHTNDGITRFNPNLYCSGKVCLSILNTWHGESWSSCQSIRSILLTILGTVLNEKPLLNEPGIREDNPSVENYNKVIHYKNYESAFLGVLKGEIASNISIGFQSFIREYVIQNKEKIINNLEQMINKYPHNCIIFISIYNFKTNIKYNDLTNKIKLFLLSYLD